jgi:hypothetical protein
MTLTGAMKADFKITSNFPKRKLETYEFVTASIPAYDRGQIKPCLLASP